jgi:ferredoxin--NADP+ reductase
VSGWIKRGPSGVIGTNKPDSHETVASLLEDLPRLAPCPQPDPGPLRDLLAGRGVRVVTFEDWQRLDANEVERGRGKGKPREKFTSVQDMVRFLG